MPSSQVADIRTYMILDNMNLPMMVQWRRNHGANGDWTSVKISALLCHVQAEQDADGKKGARTDGTEMDQCIHDACA